MTEVSLGPLARTVLLIVGVAAIGVTTLLWQYLYTGDATLAQAVAGIVPTAAIGAVASYYALHG